MMQGIPDSTTLLSAERRAIALLIFSNNGDFSGALSARGLLLRSVVLPDLLITVSQLFLDVQVVCSVAHRIFHVRKVQSHKL